MFALNDSCRIIFKKEIPVISFAKITTKNLAVCTWTSSSQWASVARARLKVVYKTDLTLCGSPYAAAAAVFDGMVA